MAGVEQERRQGMEALVSDWTDHDKLTLGRALEQVEHLPPRRRQSGQGRGLNTGYGRSVA